MSEADGPGTRQDRELRSLAGAADPADLTAGAHVDAANPMAANGMANGKYSRSWGRRMRLRPAPPRDVRCNAKLSGDPVKIERAQREFEEVQKERAKLVRQSEGYR